MNLAALHAPDFRRYMAASGIALNGIWIQRLTFGWLAWDLTQSASFTGLVAGLNFVPAVFSGPFFGVLADRADLRRAAIWAQLAMCALCMLVLGIYLAGWLAPLVLAGMSLATGLAASAYSPVRMALVPRLAPRAAMGSVVVLTSLNFNLSRLTGPALGGLMIAKLGVGAALIALALAPLPLIALLWGLTLRPADKPRAPAQRFLADLRAGLAYALATPLVRRAMWIVGLTSFAGRGVLELLPAIADGAFARGAVGLGQLTAAAGAGAIVSALIQAFGRATPGEGLARQAQGAALASCLLVGLLGWSSHWGISLLAVAGLGFCGTLIGVSLQANIQLSLPDNLRGRVMSLWVLVALGATASGAFVLGAMADGLGLSLTLGLASGAVLVALLAGIWRA